MKKTLALTLVLISALLLATACSSTSASNDLTRGKTPEQIVAQAFNQFYQLENYEMDISYAMKANNPDEPFDMSITAKATYFQKPALKFKMVMDMSTTPIVEFDGMAQFEQYMIQDGDKFTLYQQVFNQWQKMTIDDPAMTELMQMDPIDNLKLFMDNLERVEIVGEEKIGDSDTLKIDLIASAKIFDQLLKDAYGYNLQIPDEFITNDVFSKIGDIRYLIWVDKSTLNIVKCSMDLSENMRNLGTALSEIEGSPADIKDLFANLEMTMEYTISNINSASDFEVPEEAKNAPELMLP